MTKLEALKKFCAIDDGRYGLSVPHIVTVKGMPYTFATDGHRAFIVDGHIEGVEAGGPNIGPLLKERTGVNVSTAKLKSFLGPCEYRECGRCRSGIVYCTCPECDDEHSYECGCNNRPIRTPIYRVLATAGLNAALLSEMLSVISAETVTVLVSSKESAIHVFADTVQMIVMPMRYSNEHFKDAPSTTLEALQ